MVLVYYEYNCNGEVLNSPVVKISKYNALLICLYIITITFYDLTKQNRKYMMDKIYSIFKICYLSIYIKLSN